MKLIEKARAVTANAGTISPTEEQLELTLAFYRGEISSAQVRAALETGSSKSSVVIKLSNWLRTAIREKRVRIDPQAD